jgi:hypothetical protein
MDGAHFIFLRVHRTTDWSALSAIDWCLIAFNSVEAIFWFGCSVYVFRRNAVAHRSRPEYLYATLFLLFGFTDVAEIAQVSSPLIWLKLLILIPLFLLRQRVMAAYSPKPRLV